MNDAFVLGCLVSPPAAIRQRETQRRLGAQLVGVEKLARRTMLRVGDGQRRSKPEDQPTHSDILSRGPGVHTRRSTRSQ